MRTRVTLAIAFLLNGVACGSSSSSDSTPATGGSGGSGAAISCDDAAALVTAPPVLDPSTIPVGKTTQVKITIPVTRSAYRVIVQMSEADKVAGAIGVGEQAYNDAKGCEVVVPVSMNDGVSPGRYYPDITIQLDPKDGGSGDYIHYMYNPAVSKTNYTRLPPGEGATDSGVAIAYVTVQ